jgi:hypothetical protein
MKRATTSELAAQIYGSVRGDISLALAYERARALQRVECNVHGHVWAPGKIQQCPQCGDWQAVYSLSDRPDEHKRRDAQAPLCSQWFETREEAEKAYEALVEITAARKKKKGKK